MYMAIIFHEIHVSVYGSYIYGDCFSTNTGTDITMMLVKRKLPAWAKKRSVGQENIAGLSHKLALLVKSTLSTCAKNR